MTNHTTFTDRRLWTWTMWVGMAAIGVWLAWRAQGAHPSVFADEWYYSEFSRLKPLAASTIPSYLYLWLFGATSACGDRFYDCAHAGNALLLCASAPFVYLIGRQFAGRALAALLALLSLLAPLNLYTAFYMPEATYFLGFCVLSWVTLTRTGWHWAVHAGASGAVLGLMSLVKLHALFLAPALCLYLLLACRAGGGRWFARGTAAMALALGSLFAIRFGLGYLLAGSPALHLFGDFYQNTAASSKAGLPRLLPAAFINARGHLMALAMLVPLPLALIGASLLRLELFQPNPRARLQLYTLLMLGAAAGVTILYTASIANPGVTDEGLRLHLRYYSFVFPLLWLVAAAALPEPEQPRDARLRWTLALVLCAVLAAAWFRLPTYSLNQIDGPEIIALDPAMLPGRMVLLLDVAVLLLWAAGRKVALPLYLFAVLPATLAFAGVRNEIVVASSRNAGPAEHAAAAARRLVPPDERGLLTLAGSNLWTLMRARFDLDSPDASLLTLAEGAPVERYRLPVHNKWLLVLGQHALPDSPAPVAQTGEFALLRLSAHHREIGRADLRHAPGTGIVSGTEGLSSIESWGRWSDSKQVVLHLSRPLPRHARVILKAMAYDVNAGLPFTVHAGDGSASFRLGTMMQDIALELDTDGNARTLVIDVPHPLAPSEHGQPDRRTLGIGIAGIAIGDRDPEQVATN